MPSSSHRLDGETSPETAPEGPHPLPSPEPGPQSPQAAPETRSPLFSTPSRPQLPPPSPDPSWSPDDLPSLDGAGDPDSVTPSGSRTGSSKGARLRSLRASAKAAVSTVGGIAHQLLTREGSPEREVGLYLPDDDDVKAIGDPLVGLASRRLPEGAANPDATDLIGLVFALVTYGAKQAMKRAQLDRHAVLEGTIEDQADEQPGPVDV